MDEKFGSLERLTNAADVYCFAARRAGVSFARACKAMENFYKVLSRKRYERAAAHVRRWNLRQRKNK